MRNINIKNMYVNRVMDFCFKYILKYISHLHDNCKKEANVMCVDSDSYICSLCCTSKTGKLYYFRETENRKLIFFRM